MARRGSVFLSEKVQSVNITDQSFKPRFPIELAKGTGYVSRPFSSGRKTKTRTSSRRSHSISLYPQFSGAIGDLFGRSVSIHEDIIVIGANFHDSAGPNNGAAYVFVKKGSKWVQLTKLIAPKMP